MFGHLPKHQTQNIGFLLTPQFSMIAFTSAIEPLRSANRVARKTLFKWQLFTIDGEPVKASNNVVFNPDNQLTEKSEFDVLFVCAGVRSYDHLNKKTSNLLRSLSRRGIPLGSICTGTVALAEAGLLDGHRCTIHWENIESLAERYPKLNITSTIFESDRNRHTCSGGLAAMDMMLYSIQLDYGRELAMQVSDQMLYSSIRSPEDLQRMETSKRTGITHPKMLAAIGYMEAHIEQPIILSNLAKSVGLSLRQLERLFRSELSTTPTIFYRELRLDKARLFLRQTSLALQEIAIATGFNSASYFAKSYKAKFGYSPKQEREKI